MNTLPLVFASSAVCAAIMGHPLMMWVSLGCAALISIYTNYQWNKVWVALAKVVAAAVAKR